ncbi:MAG: Rieske (2Fe-2S) protein [Rubrobacteraceae bacterium]|uniref:Rieske (2Fe-2S) protein n=1 Tax=Rubrobacter calidifluminis TaxID=1392640 RepID=UPI0023607207|nr:Rieske (2Fe-2S) protein [Rubrobacter calidifluminis]MBX6765039.1 Rieske (2Fe-2S) protein [Rubrobacteraceae bacterium]
MDYRSVEAPRRRRYVLCAREELAPGEMRRFRAGSRSVTLARLDDGSYRAVSSTCPHEAADLSKGRVERMWTASRTGEHVSSKRCVIVCPWHNFEFDLASGLSPCEPHRRDMRLRVYPVALEGEEVVVYV